MSEKTREYRHDDGRTQGVYDGTELDKQLANDPEWHALDGSDQPAPEQEPDSSGESPELERLKRDALDDTARAVGVREPEGLANKGAVIAAIREKQEGPAADTGDEG